MATYPIVTRTDGTLVTASIWNADHQNHPDHNMPPYIEGWSVDTTQMRAQTDPGNVGSENPAGTLSGEIERLRYAIWDVKRAWNANAAPSYWYQPVFGTSPLFSGDLLLPAGKAMYGVGAGQVNRRLIGLAADDNLTIGGDLASGKQILLLGPIWTVSPAQLRSTVTLQMGQWLQWDTVQALLVDSERRLVLGENAAWTYINSDGLTVPAESWITASGGMQFANISQSQQRIYLGGGGGEIRFNFGCGVQSDGHLNMQGFNIFGDTRTNIFCREIQVVTGIAKQGAAFYTYPDHVFTEPVPPLAEVARYCEAHHRLPSMPRPAGGPELFARTDALEAEVERLYLYLFDHERRLDALTAR
jgi:hypothetical protein